MDTLIGTVIGILVFGCPAILVLAGVGIAWWFFTGKAGMEANRLRNKFHQLGTVAGKTRAEIEKAVGPPSSWSAIGDNRTSCSWNTQKYYVTLIFQDDICEGIQSELSV